MRIYTEAAILRAKSYTDIFSKDKDEAKKQFRYYCKSYHPDVDNSPNAQKIFGKLMELYNKVSSNKTVAHPDDKMVFLSKATGKGFEIVSPVSVNAGTCMIHHTAKKVVLSYNKDFKKSYDKYLDEIKKFRYEDEAMRKQFEPLFPKVIKQFEDTEGNFIILLDKTDEVLNLGVILDAYRRKGEAFPKKHAAWIVNRLYNLEAYLHFYKRVFNGFSINNLWVSPEFHTVLLLNGWEYCTNIGDKMIGCPKDVYKVLPIKVRDNHLSHPLTDMESIKQIGRELFKGSDCTNILKFLDEGSEDVSPLDEWKEFENAVMADFGVRKFVVWDDVPYAN